MAIRKEQKRVMEMDPKDGKCLPKASAAHETVAQKSFVSHSLARLEAAAQFMTMIRDGTTREEWAENTEFSQTGRREVYRRRDAEAPEVHLLATAEMMALNGTWQGVMC